MGSSVQEKVAIITGASSGIGQATALALARKGCAVVVAARRGDLLADLARRCEQLGVEALDVVTDVSHREQVDALVTACVERFGRVDVMVNNAGHGVHARVHETTDEQMRRIFDTNYFSVFFGCRAVAPVMIAQGSGHIFNVSSVIGKRGTPFNGAYCATKFAICGLSDAMRVEMLDYNVRVTTVCPGMTDTPFFDAVEGRGPRRKMEFSRLRGRMSPDVVAERIVATVGKHKPELVFSIGGKLLALLGALTPSLADRVLKRYHDEIVRSSSQADRTEGR